MSSRSAALALLLLAAGLQLSACWVKELKGIRNDWDSRWSGAKQEDHVLLEDALKSLPHLDKRAAVDRHPILNGTHTFEDGFTYARIYYSGGDSTVIFVLTYRMQNGIPISSNLYRSTDYGALFTGINSLLESNVVLSPNFFTSDFNQNFLMFAHATAAKLYYTLNEGETFQTRVITPATINPRSIKDNPNQDGWMMAFDSSSALYVTRNFAQTWSKVDDNVAFFQWGDEKWDASTLTIYYTTREPGDPDRTVNLFTSTPPYTTHKEFDPKLGSHDAFLVYGPYIFAQRTDAGKVNLYVSHARKPFQQAMIPTPYNHQNYRVNHIDELQALVVVEHEGGFYNLYLSDTVGVHFSLSLRDIVVEARGLDLEIIEGVNGTMIANQYVRDDPSQQDAPVRTLITLDNGGFWELILPPDEDVNNVALNCEPPACSLHLHMDSSEYARLGVYSTSSAPGLIMAHGSANKSLSENPDLYISRDGGITWEETLPGSWGINVADHGGLMVAARDYHQESSSELKYSCDEGYSWDSFSFTQTASTIYGVITEPGQHTTVMSLYGTTKPGGPWIVFTLDFASIFLRKCTNSDYIQWMPWDMRSDTDCILGSAVTIERRRAQTCCLNGRDYDREVSVDICECNSEDFECDYGYDRGDLNGPCMRDPDVKLVDPCADGVTKNYTGSSGYRKVAGDVCKDGVEHLYDHFIAPCCGNTTLPPTFPITYPSSVYTSPATQQNKGSSSNSGALIGTGTVLAILCVVAGATLLTLLVVALKYTSLRQRYLRLITAGEGPQRTFAFHSDRESSQEPLTLGGEDTAMEADDDDAPIVP